MPVVRFTAQGEDPVVCRRENTTGPRVRHLNWTGVQKKFPSAKLRDVILALYRRNGVLIDEPDVYSSYNVQGVCHKKNPNHFLMIFLTSSVRAPLKPIPNTRHILTWAI